MECMKWESEGLLYCASELTADETINFEQHLAECDECQKELSEYREMFGDFTVVELLEEVPSVECDNKIIAAIEKERKDMVRKAVVMPGLFSLFMHRVAIPAAIFAFAVIIGLRFAGHDSKGVVADNVDVEDTTQKVDSINDTGRVFRQGEEGGAIPVTLEE